MGVLDEAIRQHLELKRQRGADAGEIKREEDEALGEVRVTRGPGTRAAEAEAAPAQEAEAPPSKEHDPIVHQPTEAFNPAEVADALGHSTEDPVAEPQHEAEPEPDPPEPDEGLSPATEEPVAEAAAVEEVVAEETDEAAEGDEQAAADELEETPEFLEDAPEHDKLWFEQKPPKDFDF